MKHWISVYFAWLESGYGERGDATPGGFVVRCDRDFNNATYAEGDPAVNRNYTVAILLKESCLIKLILKGD